DPAWTPPPVTAGERWERETDVDWIDDRLRKMDTGPTFNATFTYPGPKGRTLAYKGTAIRVGAKGEAAVLFARNQLRLACGWVREFRHHGDRRFGLLNTPSPAGKAAFATASGPGWADAQGKWASNHPATAPLPRAWGRYRGMYLHGKRVVLSYTLAGVEVLESPWVESGAGATLFTRTFAVGPSRSALRLLACTAPAGSKFVKTEQPGRCLALQHGGAWAVAAPLGAPGLHPRLGRGGPGAVGL